MYEQKYKEALERAKDLISRCKTDRDRRTMIYRLEDIESLFPELVKPDDEKIRKRIIKFLIDVNNGAYTKSELEIASWIGWLEKQGQKSIDMSIKEKAHQIAWEMSKHYDPLLSKESWCEMAALDMASWLEKQGEMNNIKCVNERT